METTSRIVSRPLSEQLTELIRSMIITGRIEPGARINEVSFAAQFEVSRAPLREALRRLTSEGLLEATANKGVRVKTYTVGELEELFQLRAALESLAVRLAISRNTDHIVEQLEKLLSATRMELVEEGVGEEGGPGYPRDRDFHDALVNLVKHSQLSHFYNILRSQIELSRVTSGADPERASAAYAEHCELVSRIRQRDWASAERALISHLQNSLRGSVGKLTDAAQGDFSIGDLTVCVLGMPNLTGTGTADES